MRLRRNRSTNASRLHWASRGLNKPPVEFEAELHPDKGNPASQQGPCHRISRVSARGCSPEASRAPIGKRTVHDAYNRLPQVNPQLGCRSCIQPITLSQVDTQSRSVASVYRVNVNWLQ